MTGFHEVRFPEAIARGATGGPGYDTTILTTVAGYERRNANWAQARGRWDVGSGLKQREDLLTLIAFFRARQGRAYGFRFKDWTDFAATDTILGIGDGSNKTFQMVKRYRSGGIEVVRSITKPVSGTLTIYRDGVVEGAGVSLDATSGLVTFAIAPSSGVVVSASFEFDVPVRFDTDQMGMSLDAYDRGTWGEIPILEIRA